MSSLAILAHLRFLGLMMIGAYALINAILSPVTAGWPIWASTLLAVPPMVMGMVHLVLPIARRHLARPDGKRA